MLVSAHAAGTTVSSLALALSGPRPTLLAEARALGGSIRSGYRQGQWGGEIGLAHLADADRTGDLPEAFEAHLRRLDEEGNRLILPGLTDPQQAGAMVRTWDPLMRLLQAMDQHAGYDVVIDGGPVVLEPGRVHSTLFPAPLLHSSDVVLLVLRNTLASIAQTAPIARVLRSELAERGRGEGALRLLLIEEGRGIPSGEIAKRLQIPLLQETLPWDPDAAELFTHGSQRPPRLAKLALMKRARRAWEQIGVLVRDRELGLSGNVPVQGLAMAGVLQRLAQQRGVNARG